MDHRFSRITNGAIGAALAFGVVFYLVPRWLDESGAPFLRKAASAGEIDSVRWFIWAGVELDSQDHQQRTALHLSSQNGHAEVVKALLDAGAGTRTRDMYGKRALHWAVRGNDTQLARLLLASPTELDPQHPQDAALLRVAVGYGNTEMAELLIDAGADVNSVTDRDRRAPVHAAVGGRHLATLRLLISRGADPDCRDGHGRSPLSIARRNEDFEILNYLSDAGAPLGTH